MINILIKLNFSLYFLIKKWLKSSNAVYQSEYAPIYFWDALLEESNAKYGLKGLNQRIQSSKAFEVQ